MVIFWTLFIFLEGVTLDIEHLVQILTVASSHLHMINALKKGCSHGRAMFFLNVRIPSCFLFKFYTRMHRPRAEIVLKTRRREPPCRKVSLHVLLTKVAKT